MMNIKCLEKGVRTPKNPPLDTPMGASAPFAPPADTQVCKQNHGITLCAQSSAFQNCEHDSECKLLFKIGRVNKQCETSMRVTVS